MKTKISDLSEIVIFTALSFSVALPKSEPKNLEKEATSKEITYAPIHQNNNYIIPKFSIHYTEIFQKDSTLNEYIKTNFLTD